MQVVFGTCSFNLGRPPSNTGGVLALEFVSAIFKNHAIMYNVIFAIEKKDHKSSFGIQGFGFGSFST
jgi:hypothetical protein